MPGPEVETIEAEVRRLWEARDFDGAMSTALSRYGDEIPISEIASVREAVP